MGRLVRDYNNKPVTATVGGKECHFRSTFEFKWALYLDFLVNAKEIIGWTYEEDLFIFHGEVTAPIQYRPDFKVTEKDGTVVYQETKGYHDGQTNTKLRRMASHYPDTIFDLVLMSIPGNRAKGANRRRIAEKYTRRIIDAGVIFRQLKGVINFKPPIIMDM